MSYPNPANLQARIGFETVEGLGDSASLLDMRLRSETVGGNFPLIDVDDIVADAETPAGLPTKIDPSGDFNLNWAAEDHGKLLANFQGHGKSVATLTSGVYRHRLSPKESDLTFRTLQAEISRDDGRPVLYSGIYVSGIDMSVSPRGLLQGKASLVIPRFRFWKDAAASAGTPTTTGVYLRGIANYANLDQDVYVKITTDPSGGSMGIKVKVGSGGTYSATEITVTAGVWVDLKEGSSDAHIGSEEAPVQIYFAALSGYSVSTPDVLLFAALRTVWSQSLPVASPSNEISMALYIDGSSTPSYVRDIALSATRPAVRDETIGGRWVDTVLPLGKRTAQLSIKRRSIDRTLTNRLLHAKYLSFRLDSKGAQISTTAYRRTISAIGMYAVPAGKTPSVQSATQFDDDITFTLHPSSDATYPSSLVFEVINSQSVLQ